jgi:hypothetical protein
VSNPYAAPRAQVADERSDLHGNFVPGGHGVPAGNGWSWIASAWRIFRGAPGTWIGGLLVFFVILVVSGMVPFIGTIASSALWPVFVAGFASAARIIDQGGEPEFHEFFAGFRGRFGLLIILGLISLAISVAVFLGVFAVMGIGFFAMMSGEVEPEAMQQMGITLLLAVLIAVALLLPLAMATWFAPVLVMFHDLAPLEAMKASFAGCLKAMLAFLVYGAVLFFAALFASLPIFLGWLVLGPVMAASVYTAYRDIYFTE